MWLLECHQIPTLEMQGALIQKHTLADLQHGVSHTKLCKANTHSVPAHKTTGPSV